MQRSLPSSAFSQIRLEKQRVNKQVKNHLTYISIIITEWNLEMIMVRPVRDYISMFIYEFIMIDYEYIIFLK